MDGNVETVEHDDVIEGEATEISNEQVAHAAETALTKIPGETGGRVQAIVPRDIDQAWRYSQIVMKAGMAPASYDTEAKVMIGIVKGMELGLPPLTALQSIYIVNNRPTIWGDGAMAMVWKSGYVEDFKEWWDEETKTAHCRIKRKSVTEPIERSFSMEDAKAANLTSKNSPWKTYPKRMCQMRARSWALRDGFADVLMGLAIAEEVADYSGNRMVQIGENQYAIESTTVEVNNPLDDDAED